MEGLRNIPVRNRKNDRLGEAGGNGTDTDSLYHLELYCRLSGIKTSEQLIADVVRNSRRLDLQSVVSFDPKFFDLPEVVDTGGYVYNPGKRMLRSAPTGVREIVLTGSQHAVFYALLLDIGLPVSSEKIAAYYTYIVSEGQNIIFDEALSSYDEQNIKSAVWSLRKRINDVLIPTSNGTKPTSFKYLANVFRVGYMLRTPEQLADNGYT